MAGGGWELAFLPFAEHAHTNGTGMSTIAASLAILKAGAIMAGTCYPSTFLRTLFNSSRR